MFLRDVVTHVEITAADSTGVKKKKEKNLERLTKPNAAGQQLRDMLEDVWSFKEHVTEKV